MLPKKKTDTSCGLWVPKTFHVRFTVSIKSLERLRFTFTPNGRHELYHVTTFSPYFPFTLYCFYIKISSFMPVLTIGIVRHCFYLLIFYSEKFSTWVWRLLFAVNVNLNLSFIMIRSPLVDSDFGRRFVGSFYVPVKLPTYPSPKPTLTLSSYLGQNVGLGEG